MAEYIESKQLQECKAEITATFTLQSAVPFHYPHGLFSGIFTGEMLEQQKKVYFQLTWKKQCRALILVFILHYWLAVLQWCMKKKKTYPQVLELIGDPAIISHSMKAINSL